MLHFKFSVRLLWALKLLIQSICSTSGNLIWIFHIEGKRHEDATFFQMSIHGIHSAFVHCSEGVERGLREGSLRVHWGLGGVNLIEPSLNPLRTLFEIPLYSKWMTFKFRKYSCEMRSKKNEAKSRVN